MMLLDRIGPASAGAVPLRLADVPAGDALVDLKTKPVTAAKVLIMGQ